MIAISRRTDLLRADYALSDTAAAIRCARCAALVSDDAAFCSHCGVPLHEQPVSNAPGVRRAEEAEQIAAELRGALAPRYELLDVLGEGGMGFAFRAREESRRRLVAVKVLSPSLAEDDVARARFTREARAVAAISHANVIGVYGVGETPMLRLPFIVMQYVDGPTLSAWMRTHRRSHEATARRIVGEVAGALAAAHAHGVVHRDVKPSNVLIEATTGRAIVVDFGVSGLLAPDDATSDLPRVTTTGIVVGTPVYMSPEQAAGDIVQAPSDVYSLGIVAYELFANDLPFKANSAMGWAAAHMRDTPAPLAARRPEISPEVAQLVDRCLVKDPVARPRAQEVAAAMAPSIESEHQWPPPGLAPLAGRGHLLGRVAIVLGVAAATVATCLTLQPALARADSQWWTRYAEGRDVSGSVLGVVNETNTATSPATVWVWRIAIVGGLVALLVATIAFLVVASRAAVRAAKARSLGWRWSTLVDVLADPDGRNGLLLVGGRELAAVDRYRRRTALGARRGEVAWRIVAGGWVTLGLSVWAFVAILGPVQLAGSGALMRLPALLVLVVPAIVAVAVTRAEAGEESRALAPLPRRRLHAPTAPGVRPAESSDDVLAWYAIVGASAGGAKSASEIDRSGASLTVLTRSAVTVASALLAAGTIAVGIVIAANLIAAWNLERLGPETAHLVATMRRLRETDPLGAARRAWVGYLPTDTALSPAEARKGVERLSGRSGASGTLPQYVTSTDSLLRVGATGRARPAVADAIKAAVNGLSPDSMAMFAAAAEHPRTALVRRLSVAGTEIFTASLDRPLDTYRQATDVPEPPYPQLRAGAQANALGAVVAIARRDYAEAERRLGENAALAERFLAVPRRFAGTFGAGLLQELALLPLAEVQDLRGDPRPGAELRRAADEVRILLLDPAWSSRLIGLAATPDDMRAYTAAIRDPRLPAGLRAEGFEGGLVGFCLNAREVVRGPQANRREAVRLAADSIPDMREGPVLAALVLRWWHDDRSTSVANKAFGSVLTRIAFCANIGRH